MVKSAAYFEFPQFVAYKKAAREGERTDWWNQRGESNRIMSIAFHLNQHLEYGKFFSWERKSAKQFHATKTNF